LNEDRVMVHYDSDLHIRIFVVHPTKTFFVS
jgi:hypothetical protein